MGQEDIVSAMEHGMLFTRLSDEQKRRVARRAAMIRIDEGEATPTEADPRNAEPVDSSL